jgi:heme o synthase
MPTAPPKTVNAQLAPRSFGGGLRRVRFHEYAWGVLAYTLAVIVWGAFVRASVSGDGCGSHWPTCNGEVIPTSGGIKTLVEFTHRVTSGLTLFAVIGLVAWARSAFPKGHPARTAALLSLVFTITEALVGAALVLNRLVADNASITRGFVMGAHLVNTFLLLAALALTARWATTGRRITLSGQGGVAWTVWIGVIGTMLVAVSGAISALGDTLFPAATLAEGLRQDFSPTAHLFIRLRFLHPLIAMSVGLVLTLAAGLFMHLRPSLDVKRYARWMGALVFAQMAAGLVNLALLAPIAMQLLHLLLADFVWIALVLVSAEALAEDAPRAELELAGPQPVDGQRPGLRDYVALTKPRVISLLLFTTLAAMVIAARSWPGSVADWLLYIAVAVGGYASAGSANAINMVIDRDIDGRMERTSRRPTVTQRIPSRDALMFALALAVFSFATLWVMANLLTAALSLAGLVFYVVVYTLLLKRRTWTNIVIGGAAGAFPPLVGWAAVTGDLGYLAWILFAIIFVWTPVHFWALALLLKDDYALAGVPMLPVVRGVHATVVQISVYAVLTVGVSALPLMRPGEVGWIYLTAFVLLNGLLLLRSAQLYRRPERPQAGSLFKYSMLYLALLFLVMAVDRTVLT